MINSDILKFQEYLKPNEPVDVTSEDIKGYLKELGWCEGDKIPTGMQEYTTAVLRYLNKPVSIRSLPVFFGDETVQATLRSALAKTKLYVAGESEVEERVKERMPNRDTLHPGTVDTLVKLNEQIVKQEMEKEAEMHETEDTLTEDDGFSDVGSDVDEEPLTEEEVKEEVAEIKKHIICPRCMWDISQPYEPYPVTEEDKFDYAVSILGGGLFKKSYKVAHDLLEITYAAPNANVRRLLEMQLKYDGINGRIQSEDHYYLNSLRYGLATSLYEVKALKGVDKNKPIPDLEEDRFHQAGDTNIYLFTKYIEEEIIGSGVRESFFRETYNDFVWLQIHLNKTIDSENFLEAVLDKLS